MIEFLTLLLGLVSGVQTVEVGTAVPVARVEVRLDGETAATAEAPPWRFRVDLGDELAPHELTAVAFDASGHELGRARQRLNLPRGDAEARWVLETGKEGRPRTATLVWEQMWSADPERVDVDFDGTALTLDADARVRLPPYDPQEIHLLSAELSFPGGGAARAVATFGGVFGERVESELTAVPVIASGSRRRELRPEDLAGRFAVAGQELRVAAVDGRGTDLVVVRDAAAQETLSSWVVEVERRYRRLYHRSPRDLLPLGRDARVRFVWTFVAATVPGEVDPSPAGPFAEPKRYALNGAGLSWLLSRAQPPRPTERVADAVALAALFAAAGDRPRAVVLITDAATKDDSRYTPAQVRAYLNRLHVPLIVWSLGAAPPPGWGTASPLDGWSDLRAAVRALHDELHPQAIVWLAGRHLPQEIELMDRGTGLRWP